MGVLIKRGSWAQRQTCTEGRWSEKTQGEMATSHPRNPQASRSCEQARNGLCPVAITGTMALLTSWFGTLASRTVRPAPKPSSVWYLITPPWGTNTWIVEHFLTKRGKYRGRLHSTRAADVHQDTMGLHESYKEKRSQRTIWLEVGAARVGALGLNVAVGTLSVAGTLLPAFPSWPFCFPFQQRNLSCVGHLAVKCFHFSPTQLILTASERQPGHSCDTGTYRGQWGSGTRFLAFPRSCVVWLFHIGPWLSVISALTFWNWEGHQ